MHTYCSWSGQCGSVTRIQNFAKLIGQYPFRYMVTACSDYTKGDVIQKTIDTIMRKHALIMLALYRVWQIVVGVSLAAGGYLYFLFRIVCATRREYALDVRATAVALERWLRPGLWILGAQAMAGPERCRGDYLCTNLVPWGPTH